MPTHGTFRYFLPGFVDRQPERLLAEVRARGLGDRLDDVVTGQLTRDQVESNHCRCGPEGLEGLLLVPQPHDGGNVARGQYVPEHQEWQKSERGDYWIGFDREHRPTPEGLRRREVVSGYEHELGDGNTWLCPTIRRAIVFPAVPCSYRRMNGVLQRQPLAKYAGIFERAQRWAAQYLGGDGVPPEEQWEASIECLRVNYRLGDEEASLLDVLTDRTMPLVLDAALDVPWLNEALSGSDPEKKSLLDWLHSELGTSEVGDTG